MRHGNLSDGGHDKVTWKPSRDLLTSCCSNRTQETQWRCTTVMLWCVSFKSYRRCYRGILMDRHDFEPLRCLGDIPLRCCWLFHLTYLRHCGDVLMGHCHFILLRHHDNIPIRCCGDVPLRHLGNIPLRLWWVFHLRHTCNITETYRGTSSGCHLNILLQGGT